jgi:hypothetical protein
VTALFARVPVLGRSVWAVVFTGAAVGAILVVALFLRRRARDRAVLAIEDAIAGAWRAREVASARAAVTIAAARAEQGAVRDELQAALDDRDEERQAERLMEISRRLRDKPKP